MICDILNTWKGGETNGSNDHTFNALYLLHRSTTVRN